jgi:cytochrome c oxidase subunit 2
VGEVVEFVVTSVDVTHGFALYDPQKRIVAQIQAMPGFVNKVRHRFDSPGKYEVLCLEFCGLAHHGMVAEIHVTPAN